MIKKARLCERRLQGVSGDESQEGARYFRSSFGGSMDRESDDLLEDMAANLGGKWALASNTGLAT